MVVGEGPGLVTCSRAMPYASGVGTESSVHKLRKPPSSLEPAMASSSASLAKPMARLHSAYREGAPGSENCVTAGSSMALLRPCGTWK